MDVASKLSKVIDFIKQIVLSRKTGRIEINISQGGITNVMFTEKVI